MTHPLKCGAAILVLFAVAACQQTPELMRRYKTIDGPSYQAADPGIEVTVGLFSLEEPASSPKGVLDLSDRGQAKYVEAVAEKAASARDLRADLAKKFKAPSGLDSDFTRLSRRLVFSTIDEGFGPADRLEELRLKLEILNDRAPNGSACNTTQPQTCSNIQFISWDRFSTIYGEVDLGQVTLTRSLGVDAEIGLGVPIVPEGASVSIAPKLSRDLKEELKVRRRHITLAGQLEPYKLKLLQEGNTGIDLIGTSQVDVDLNLGEGYSVPVHYFSIKDDQPALASGRHVLPVAGCSVRVMLTGQYRVRKVLQKADTVIEGDDKVRFLIDDLPKEEHTLVRGDQLGGARFELKLTPNIVLQVLPPGVSDVQANYEPLYFTSAENTQRFRLWMQDTLSKGDSIDLTSKHGIGLRDLDTLRVQPLSLAEAQLLREVPSKVRSCVSDS